MWYRFAAACLISTSCSAGASGGASSADDCLTPSQARSEAATFIDQNSGKSKRASDRRAAFGALAKINALRFQLKEGAQLPKPYEDAANLRKLARSAGHPRLRNLYRRAAEDQFRRMHGAELALKLSWANGLSNAASQFVMTIVAQEVCRTDRQNRAWLKRQVDRHGWFKRSAYGEAADNAAWLLAQHADDDPLFQAEILSLLARLLPAGETSGRNFAYLFDRVALKVGRPQRFGTQGGCAGPGEWSPRPIEELEKLDERRRQVGLGSMQDYQKQFRELCGEAEPPFLPDDIEPSVKRQVSTLLADIRG